MDGWMDEMSGDHFSLPSYKALASAWASPERVCPKEARWEGAEQKQSYEISQKRDSFWVAGEGGHRFDGLIDQSRRKHLHLRTSTSGASERAMLQGRRAICRALLRRGVDWSRSYGAAAAGGGRGIDDPVHTPSSIPQHFGPGKLVGKTALITGKSSQVPPPRCPLWSSVSSALPCPSRVNLEPILARDSEPLRFFFALRLGVHSTFFSFSP